MPAYVVSVSRGNGATHVGGASTPSGAIYSVTGFPARSDLLARQEQGAIFEAPLPRDGALIRFLCSTPGSADGGASITPQSSHRPSIPNADKVARPQADARLPCGLLWREAMRMHLPNDGTGRNC